MFLKKLTFLLPVSAVLGGFFFFQNACTKEYVEKDPICFERDVRPIITANCMGSGCHNAIDKEKGRDYSTYQGIMRDVEAGDYRSSELYKVIVKTSGEEAMPPKPFDRLTTDQIRTIAIWIEEGASNDTCATVACDTTGTMRYSLDIRPILQTNCAGAGCHSGSAPAYNISYSSYSTTKTSALDGSLLGSVQHKSGYFQMPKGGNKLPDCSIAKIQKWVAAGAPNN